MGEDSRGDALVPNKTGKSCTCKHNGMGAFTESFIQRNISSFFLKLLISHNNEIRLQSMSYNESTHAKFRFLVKNKWSGM